MAEEGGRAEKRRWGWIEFVWHVEERGGKKEGGDGKGL